MEHRHWVFTIPACLRWCFRFHRKLLGDLAGCAADTLIYYMQQITGHKEAYPVIIVVIQTAGDRLTWNPHIHIIATVGCLAKDRRYYRAGYLPYDIFLLRNILRIRKVWQDRVLRMLVDKGIISLEYANKLKNTRIKSGANGFMLNGQIQDNEGDPKVMDRLVEYVIRQPIGDSRIVNYSRERRTVTIKYRARESNSKKSKRMMTETIDALEFIARFVQHIPDKGMQMVRDYGVYSNVVRGKDRKLDKGEDIEVVEDEYGMRSDYRKSWRIRRMLRSKKFIWRIYEVDPLRCLECGGNMHIVEIVCKEEDIKEILKSMSKPKRWFYNSFWHGG